MPARHTQYSMIMPSGSLMSGLTSYQLLGHAGRHYPGLTISDLLRQKIAINLLKKLRSKTKARSVSKKCKSRASSRRSYSRKPKRRTRRKARKSRKSRKTKRRTRRRKAKRRTRR